jgi:nucleoside transporter
MTSFLKTRLATMMFLEYVIWGSWYVTISTYLTVTLHFTGTQAGAVFGTVSIAALISPFFVGLVADRFFATERVMGVLYIAAAVLIYMVTKVTTFPAVFGLMIAFCLCYFPTVALTNSITMQNVKDPGRDFPPIRVLGAIGWIFINNVIGYYRWEADSMQFIVAATACVAMALYSFVVLPHTPPPARGQKVTWQRAIGLDRLAMMKQPAFLVFVIASILACIPLTFYYSFTNTFLNDVGVVNAANKMTLGQISETALMLAMPFVFRRVSVRGILLMGLGAWALRYLLFANGNATSLVWMFYVAIILHGVCYDFFFVSGQLYTDQEAPSHLRSSAQGFIIFVTYGVGMLIGSLLSGGVLDYFSTTGADGVVTRDWSSFWMSSAAMSAAIMLLVLFFFRTKSMIRADQRKPIPEPEPAAIPGA